MSDNGQWTRCPECKRWTMLYPEFEGVCMSCWEEEHGVDDYDEYVSLSDFIRRDDVEVLVDDEPLSASEKVQKAQQMRAEGKMIREIADELGMSPGWVSIATNEKGLFVQASELYARGA